MISYQGVRAVVDWIPDRYRFLVAVALCYLPLIFLGYGSDSDTYATLEMGRHLRATGEYVPSRGTGYPLFEIAMAMAAPLGGAIFTNLISLGLGLWSLNMLLGLARGRLLLISIVAVQPLFIISATSSHDFMWALAFTIASASATIRGQATRAGLWGGLAVATRFQYGPVIACILLWGLIQNTRRVDRWILAAAMALGLTVVAYLLPAAWAGWSLDFLRVGMGSDELWTPLLLAGKFAYKNAYVWGLPSLVVFALFLTRRLATQRGELRAWLAQPVTIVSLIAIVVTEAIFFRYPIEKFYLLPVVPFSILLLGGLMTSSRGWILAMIIVTASLNFVNINLAQPDTPDAATGARLGLWIEKGDLTREIEHRWVLRDVDTMEGYVDTLRTFRERRHLPPSNELEALAKP